MKSKKHIASGQESIYTRASSNQLCMPMHLKFHEQMIINACTAFLCFGGLLIIKGFGSAFGWWSFDDGSGWNWAAEWGGAFVAIIATIIVASSIYIEKWVQAAGRSADRASYYVYAPLTIVAALGALISMVQIGRVVPDIVNGFAILGLVGAILRMLPFSEGEPFDRTKR